MIYLFGKGKSFEQPESVWFDVEQGIQNKVGGVIKEEHKNWSLNMQYFSYDIYMF